MCLYVPCLVEIQLWRPDYRFKSDIWDVQVPADGHRHHGPVRLNQGHHPGPYSRAVWAWVPRAGWNLSVILTFLQDWSFSARRPQKLQHISVLLKTWWLWGGGLCVCVSGCQGTQPIVWHLSQAWVVPCYLWSNLSRHARLIPVNWVTKSSIEIERWKLTLWEH